MAMEAIGNATMTYHGSLSSADSNVNKQDNFKTTHLQSNNSQDYVQDKTKDKSVDANEKQDSSVEVFQQNSQAIKNAIEQINRKAHNSVVKFGYHEETNRILIKIIDKDTEEVIKEFPPEKTLDMIAKVWDLAGLLLDERR